MQPDTSTHSRTQPHTAAHSRTQLQAAQRQTHTMAGLLSLLSSYIVYPTLTNEETGKNQEMEETAETTAVKESFVAYNKGEFLVNKEPPIIGKGSFADVVVGKRRIPNAGQWWKENECAIAVKRIHKTRSLGGKEVAAKPAYSLEEARLLLLARSHPNVINLLGVNMFDDPSNFLLFFEFIPNAIDLYEFVMSNITTTGYGVTESTACDIARQLAGALAHCHALNIAHRDVKLENALRCPTTGRVLLIDFGLASSVSTDPCLDRTLCGTASYAAPELAIANLSAKRRRFLISGSEVDEKSSRQGRIDRFKAMDVWSFGITLFSMLFGYALFPRAAIQGDAVFEVLQRVEAGGTSSFLEELFTSHYKKPCVPASARTVRLVEECVRVEASRRISMEEMHQRLSP